MLAGRYPSEEFAGLRPRLVLDRLEDGPGQTAERRRPGGPSARGPSTRQSSTRRHRDDTAGQHVQRVVRDLQLLDLARPACARPPRPTWTRSPWYLGKMMPRETSPTLCPARPTAAARWPPKAAASTWITRSTRAHVDAEFQAGGSHHGGQAAGLERLLDSARSCRDTDPWCARATSAGAPAPVPACAISSAGTALLHHRCGAFRPLTGALGGQLVQPPRTARSASRREFANPRSWDLCCSIRSSTRSSTCGQMERRGAGPSSSPSPESRPGIVSSSAMSSTGTNHLQLDALGTGRLHDGDRAGAAEERRHLLDRPHGRRQPHPLRRPGGMHP